MKIINEINSAITPLGGCICTSAKVRVKNLASGSGCACQCNNSNTNKKATRYRASKL